MEIIAISLGLLVFPTTISQCKMNEITLHKHELDAIVAFVSNYPSSVDYINISVDSSSGIGSIVKVAVKAVVNGDFVEITKTITDESSW